MSKTVQTEAASVQPRWSSEPFVVETKASLVRQRLEAAIISGELKPGDRLVLDEIARDLGVSKIPVREALASLEYSGLILQSPHSGPRVAPLSLHELRGVYLLREEMETLVARLAIESITEDDIALLRDVNSRMRACLSKGDVDPLSDLNTEFHLTIARATTYQTLVDSVSDVLRTVRRYRAVVKGLAANWNVAVDEHDAIIEALVTGDARAGADAVRAHVQNQRQIEIASELAAAADDDAV